MMNQVILVGRITEDFKDFKTLDDSGTLIKVAVTRSCKNSYGEFETDILPVVLYGTIAENTVKYCKQGDVVGVKGSLILEVYQGKKALYVKGEKITFLSPKSPKDDEDEE